MSTSFGLKLTGYRQQSPGWLCFTHPSSLLLIIHHLLCSEHLNASHTDAQGFLVCLNQSTYSLCCSRVIYSITSFNSSQAVTWQSDCTESDFSLNKSFFTLFCEFMYFILYIAGFTAHLYLCFIDTLRMQPLFFPLGWNISHGFTCLNHSDSVILPAFISISRLLEQKSI